MEVRGCDDVLVVNFGAGGGEIVGTVDLAPYAPSGYRPRPGALTRVGGYAFVMLANLSEDFLSAADSAIASIDHALRDIERVKDDPDDLPSAP